MSMKQIKIKQYSSNIEVFINENFYDISTESSKEYTVEENIKGAIEEIEFYEELNLEEKEYLYNNLGFCFYLISL